MGLGGACPKTATITQTHQRSALVGLLMGHGGRVMPRAPRICGQPGCPKTATAAGRCAEHKPQAWANRTPLDRNAHARWAKAVLTRDGHTCRHCGAPATEADHIIGRAVAPELALDLDNGQALCTPCHRAKTDAEKAAGRARRR